MILDPEENMFPCQGCSGRTVLTVPLDGGQLDFD